MRKFILYSLIVGSFISLFFVFGLAQTSPILVGSFYRSTVIVRTGQSGLIGIGDGPSINDEGVVAFVGQLPSGENLFIGDGATPIRKLRSSENLNLAFGRIVQINNANEVVARDLLAAIPGSPAKTHIRIWNGNGVDEDVTIAGGGIGEDFDAIIANTLSINNNDGIVFAARTGAQNFLVTANFDQTPVPIPLRPMLTDSGEIVVTVGGGTGDPLEVRLYKGDLSSFVTIASQSSGCTTLGRSPGISDDGRIVVFAGNCSIGPGGLGPGIFLSYRISYTDEDQPFTTPVRIAGFPGEADLGVSPVGGQELFFTDFDIDGRVGVSNAPQGNNGYEDDITTVVFIATPNSGHPSLFSGNRGLWSLRVELRPKLTPQAGFDVTLPVRPPLPVVQVGDSIPGLSGTVENFSLFDPINIKGQIGCWVRTTNTSGVSQDAIVRADPPAHFIYLDWTNSISAEFKKFKRGKSPKTGQILEEYIPVKGQSPVIPANEVSELFRARILDNAAAIMRKSDLPLPVAEYSGKKRTLDATYVRFAKRPPPFHTVFPCPEDPLAPPLGESDYDLGGTAYYNALYNGVVIDQFNKIKGGEVAVFVDPQGQDAGNEKSLAETIIHEAGHDLGLRHINPFPDDPIEVMDYEDPKGSSSPDLIEEFTRIETNIVEPPIAALIKQRPECFSGPSTQDHNNVYHLRRYVLGELPVDLQAKGLNPGSWDLQSYQTNKFNGQQLDFGVTLYNFAVLGPGIGGINAEGRPVLVFSESFDPADFSSLQFKFRADMPLEIRASSIPGDEWDLYLSIGPNLSPVLTPGDLQPGTMSGVIVRLADGAPTVVGSFTAAITKAEVIGPPGPALIVPNVVGLTQTDAQAAITGIGLIVGTVSTAASNTVPPGSVISQNPTTGSSVPPSSAVDLVVSSGPTTNTKPIADAGPDQFVAAGVNCSSNVVLNGTGSSDPDGDIIKITWRGSFGTASGPNPTVTLPVGTHTIELFVDDGKGGTADDQVVVTVRDTTPPVPDLALPPTVTGECSAQIASPPTATDNCAGPITGTTGDPLSYTQQGTFEVTWTFSDGYGNSSTQTQTVIVKDVTPPTPALASLPNVTGECSATIPSPPSATDNCAGDVSGTTTDSLIYTTQGTFAVAWTFDDGNGNAVTQPQTVEVKDVTAPHIQKVTATPNLLWPPNHKMVPVTVSASASDNCGGAPVCRISSVSSNEPVNGTGDGDTTPDWVITGALTSNLRAERSGTGTGRVYTITVECMGGGGTSATRTTTVTVSHRR